MKIAAVNFVLLLALISCTSKAKKPAADTTIVSTSAAHKAEKFDLANLTMNESIDDLLKANALSLKDGSDKESTVMGFESFATSKPELLVYDKQSLVGGAGKEKNLLVLHYGQETHQIEMYEIKLYVADQSGLLEHSLQKKLKKPIFIKDSSLNKSSIELDENGDEVKGERNDTKFQVWDDTRSGLSYFLLEKKTGNKVVYEELTVMNRKSENAAMWIKFRGFDGYKK